jgi:hypothetical protein
MSVECMSNFKVRVCDREKETLSAAIELAMLSANKYVAWSTHKDWLCFHWSDSEKDSIKFPSALQSKSVIIFVKEWLDENRPQMGVDDFDGSYEEGFELSAGYSFDLGTSFYEVFRVRKIWAEYHK